MTLQSYLRWMDMMDADQWLAGLCAVPSQKEAWLTHKVHELYRREAEALALLEPEEWVCD